MGKLLLFFALTLGSTAFAAGDAGCGLGSLIFKKNSKLIQLFAVTTNASFYSQTFGITSGTSGCTASGFVMNDKEIQYFVEANQEDLTREMAQGQGQKLTTLAALHGCVSNADAMAFGERAQSHYEQILPSPKTSAVDMVHNMRTAELAGVCHGG